MKFEHFTMYRIFDNPLMTFTITILPLIQWDVHKSTDLWVFQWWEYEKETTIKQFQLASSVCLKWAYVFLSFFECVCMCVCCTTTDHFSVHLPMMSIHQNFCTTKNPSKHFTHSQRPNKMDTDKFILNFNFGSLISIYAYWSVALTWLCRYFFVTPSVIWPQPHVKNSQLINFVKQSIFLSAADRCFELIVFFYIR